MSISQQDLTVRLQLTSCAYSKLANEFADNLKYGRKCAIDNEKTLLLLNAYIELIERDRAAKGQNIVKEIIQKDQNNKF
jgi:hypothetical protein